MNWLMDLPNLEFLLLKFKSVTF